MPNEIGVTRDVLIELSHLLAADFRLDAGELLIETEVVLGETELLLPDFVVRLHRSFPTSWVAITLYRICAHSAVDVDKRVHEFEVARHACLIELLASVLL